SAAALDRRAFAEAERALAQATTIAPHHAEVLRLTGLIRHRQGRLDDAAAALRAALAARADDALTENALGGVLSDLGDLDGAVVAFEHAFAHAPRFTPACFNLAQALLSSARVDEAIEAITRGLEIEPANAKARVVLARALKARGDVASAATEYRRAIASDPRTAQAWAGLADLKTIPLTAAEIE